MDENYPNREERLARLKKINEERDRKPPQKQQNNAKAVKLLHIRDYLHKYTNKENPKSANDILSYLSELNIEAERKSVYSDIEKLKKFYREPIEYDEKKHGYYISNPQFSAYELRIILDSIFLSHTLTLKETYEIIKKILNSMNVYDRAMFSDELKKRKPVRKSEYSTTYMAQVIKDAILEDKQISYRSFQYDKKNRDNKYRSYYGRSKPSSAVLTNPKELIWDNGKYRVVTHMLGSEDPFGFPLEHLEEVNISNQRREFHKPFDNPFTNFDSYSELIDRGQYTIDTGKEYAVTFLVNEFWIGDILDYWGHDTPIIPYEGHYVMFTIRMKLPSRQLYDWMWHMGKRTKILAPVEAIGEWTHYLSGIIDMYGYGTSDFLKGVPTSYDEMRAQKHTL